MDIFSPGSLFASLIISTIGLGFFLYGKRQKRLPQAFCGVVLMVFPYFVEDVGWMIGIAAGIVGLTWLASRAGW